MSVICSNSVLCSLCMSAVLPQFRNMVVIRVHKPVNEVICWIKCSFQQIIAFGPCCLISAWEKHLNEHIIKSEMWTGHVKWKICSEYYETAPLSYILYWRQNTFLEGGVSIWRTHPGRINETSNVFFFEMHRYAAVNLSAKGFCVLWSPSCLCNYYRSTLSPFTVGGGHMQKSLTK